MPTTKRNVATDLTPEQQQLLEQAKAARDQADELQKQAEEMIKNKATPVEIEGVTEQLEALRADIKIANDKLDKLLKPWNQTSPPIYSDVEAKKPTLLGFKSKKSEIVASESQDAPQYTDEAEGGDGMKNVVITVVIILVVLLVLFLTNTI